MKEDTLLIQRNARKYSNFAFFKQNLPRTWLEEQLFDNNVITIRQDDTTYERLLRRCFTKIPEKQLQLISWPEEPDQLASSLPHP
jgi:hypothetical protein